MKSEVKREKSPAGFPLLLFAWYGMFKLLTLNDPKTKKENIAMKRWHHNLTTFQKAATYPFFYLEMFIS